MPRDPRLVIRPLQDASMMIVCLHTSERMCYMHMMNMTKHAFLVA